MREKCQEELIESMRVKQERTDSQLKNFREVGTGLIGEQITVKVLNFQTPKMFDIINLKFKQRGFSIEKCSQNVLTEWQTVQTLIRLLH